MSGDNSFKLLREITFDHKSAECKELNAYIKAGWTLVDIRQRDRIDPLTEEETAITVYIVGNTDPEAVSPTWDGKP